MGQIRSARLDESKQFEEMRAFFEDENPGLRLTLAQVDGAATLGSLHGGMRVFWLYRGEGEVFLPEGYRTQEGDGGPLPAEYAPSRPTPGFADALRILSGGLSSAAPAAEAPLRAIAGRRRGEAFLGDIAGELWKLEHTPRPWSGDPSVEAAIASLFHCYREQGWSTRQAPSWEPIVSGDQLIACGAEQLKVRGRFACLALENPARATSHVSAARRLRYLLDTAGGCNPDFDPFRRLPLTWWLNYPGETGDGLNWVNSHVVNIPRETSPSHFHPPKAIGGSSLPQREMYLVLDPQGWGLNTWGRPARLIAFPDLRDLRRYEEYPLEPGMFLYIPPGAGHRGLDVFVNVLTIPGFKPHNEYYIDRDIRDQAAGAAPYNENAVGARNYADIEELL